MATSPISDLTDVFSKLLPIFAGSGKTTTTENSSGASINDEQNVVNQAMANSNNPAMTDTLVQNIMTQAAQSFAPVVAQQNAGGMYNTSTLQLLKNDAMARATAQSSKAVLDYNTSQQQIADAASGRLLQASKVGTKATAPGLDPNITAALGAAGLASKGYSVAKGTGLLDSAKNALGLGNPEANLAAAPADVMGSNETDQAMIDAADQMGPGGAASDTGGGIGTGFGAGGSTTGAGITLGEAPADIVGSSATDGAISSGVSAVDTVGGTSLDAVTALSATGNTTAAGVADAASVDAGTSLGDAGTSSTDALASTGTSAGIDAADSVGTDTATTAAAADGVAADAAASGAAGTAAAGAIPLAAEGAGLAAGAASGNDDFGTAVTTAADVYSGGILPAAQSIIGAVTGSIICTELKQQTKLSMKLWIACGKEFSTYPDIIKRGYYFYAIPAVRHMRKHPEGKLSRLLERLLKCRANWVAAKHRTYGSTKTVRGFCVFHGLNLIGRATGLFVREMPDWKSVYRAEAR